jgi:hypothetical protein
MGYNKGRGASVEYELYAASNCVNTTKRSEGTKGRSR